MHVSALNINTIDALQLASFPVDGRAIWNDSVSDAHRRSHRYIPAEQIPLKIAN